MSSAETFAAAKRVRIQEIKPYDALSDLDELYGPSSGHMDLPPWVYRAPNPSVDVESESDLIKAYPATIQEGRTVDQVQILNRDLLVTI
jgi:hypothetical protein